MSVTKNLIYNVINNVVAVLFPVITVPYVSRVLGVENIGIVGFATSYAGYFCTFANLGVGVYGAREIAKLKDDKLGRNKLFSELFVMMIISSLLCSIIYIYSIFASAKLYDQRMFLMIAGFTLFLSSFTLDWFFTGRENFKMITIRSVSVKVIAIGLMFAFVRNENDALWYCGITAFSTFANNLWNFLYLIKKEIVISFNKLLLKRHIKPLFTFLATNIAISVYTTLDTLMLGFMSTYSEVGYYTSATKVTRILLPFAVATTAVMIPRISYAFNEKNIDQYNYYLRKSFRVVCFFSVPMAIGLYIVSGPFVPFFFGNEFLDVIPVLQIQGLILIFVGLSNYFGIQVLSTSNKESKLLISILAGAIINFALNIILIPRYGAIGASATSAFAELIILLATMAMSFKYLRFDMEWRPLLYAILACIPMFFLIFIPLKYNNFIQLLILVSGGGTSYLIIQLFVFRNEVAWEIIDKILDIKKRII